MKKKSALVLGASSNQLFAVGTFLLALKKKMPRFTDDVIVFYDEISDEERRRFDSLGNVQLREYRCPLKDVEEFSYFMRDHYTLMVYSKYECFKLLSEYECVLWMDYDMFPIDTLYELLEPVKEGVRAIVTERIADSFEPHVRLFENERVNGIHSSVFALYDSLKSPLEIYNWCVNKTAELKGQLRCPEQAVMALAFREFGVGVYPLDFRIYSNPLTERSLYDSYAKIYHTFGRLKFWCGIDYEPWNECRKEWAEL